MRVLNCRLITLLPIKIAYIELPIKLDLKMNDEVEANSTKGLLFPRVELKNIRTETDLATTMSTTAGSLDPQKHIGLIVYNTGKNEANETERFCPGMHVWDGTKWHPLKPYPDVKIKKGDLISLKRSFEYLDPSSPEGWPEDKQEARANGRYNLGRIINTDSTSPNGTADVVDQRPNDNVNTYTTSRFYVGYKIIEEKYSLKKSYSCSYDEPDWNNVPVSSETVTEIEKIFDEGVWMTQNLRALKMPDGTSLTKNYSTNNPNLSAHIYYLPNNASSITTNNSINGVLYNWGAALGVGKPYGPPTIPANNEQGGSGVRDVTYQGICPDGWYLPSDQEWTDLANGIVNNVTKFSSVAQNSVSSVSYDATLDAAIGGYLGRAMKSTKQVYGKSTSTGGQSNTYSANGFDAYLVGSSGSAASVAAYVYGEDTYFWSSSRRKSSTDYPSVLIRQMKRGSDNFYRSYHDAEQTFSVRCKKDTE